MVFLYHLVKIIFKASPDIVHTFDTKPNIYGRLAAKLCNVNKIIGTQPGAGMVFSKYHPVFGSFGRFLFEILLKFISRISDLTIYQNNSDLELMKNKNIVNDKNSTLIVSSGVDTKYFKNIKNSRSVIPLTSNQKINVVFIARLTVSKGIIFYCKLAKRIRKQFPNIIFNVIGDIPENSKDKINQQTLESYSDDINYLGIVNNVKNTLARSDLMVFPSFFTEGVPRVLIEAASMGLPIVAFNNPGSDEVVLHGFNGYLVPIGNLNMLEKMVLKILNDKSRYKLFSKNSRSLAKNKFDISGVAKQYEKVYEKY